MQRLLREALQKLREPETAALMVIALGMALGCAISMRVLESPIMALMLEGPSHDRWR